VVKFIESLLLRWLRVPPEPAPPEGSPGSVLVFRAGKNYWRWRVLCWALAQAGILLLVLLPLLPLFTRKTPLTGSALSALLVTEAVLLVVYLIALFFTYHAQRLDYELRWYIVTDRSLRIRSGIWNVAETTMTFANIQDLRITAGPLQNLLGLADLEVSSAGGAGKEDGAKRGHVARFSGVDNAVTIRDTIVDRLKKYRDAGLGDHDEPAATPEASAQELLAEARALRAAAEARYPNTSS
jgi:uncharacterized membrane protein YdbT with pleckstrin-like domain